MKKRFFPAIFHEENGSYWVEFPGLDGCFTQGRTFEIAYKKATEALGLFLDGGGDEVKIPRVEQVKERVLYDNDFVVMVEYDEIAYLKRNGLQAVKKTLTIPRWLNVAAERANINFSKTLQDALIELLEKRGDI